MVAVELRFRSKVPPSPDACQQATLPARDSVAAECGLKAPRTQYSRSR